MSYLKIEKPKSFLHFDKLMWDFLHLHYSTSLKRDLWIRGFKDYSGGKAHVAIKRGLKFWICKIKAKNLMTSIKNKVLLMNRFKIKDLKKKFSILKAIL